MTGTATTEAAAESAAESATGSATAELDPAGPAATEPAATARPSLRDRYRGQRERARRNRAADVAWRTGVGIAGSAVLVAGIVMIPYPGPGWVVAFAGLAVLGTEFEPARRALAFLRRGYDRWDAWQRGRHPAVRLLLLAGTGAVVLGTVWLLGALEFGAGLIGLDLPWLASPLG
ncbi:MULTISPECIES: TIGR02611 family protein [unclassified Saccharopolyspora]|uniref:TIGR02611 family protein n=1 Tax=unclassified Saccharopolyspora TaxID=2646250 RepID=UPI001CD75454|nr:MULTISPECIES: TIGR02611 family protein [unclassified Saccharopolyspora]MCA1194392.1 TIGR02611 family protein [Saccharopolyspora sp. 6V]MCA1229236.1 TIGR02611 family protein [Saccharopolyspora sp. 6M]MCA1281074.1 TIGR02611 family protein [Saccharopolyspora sp. 7B]